MIRQRLLGLLTVIKKPTPLGVWLLTLLCAAVIGGGTEAAVTHTLYANLIGNVTGNVTGNVAGNVTGNVTGNLTSGSTTITATSATINGPITATSLLGLTTPLAVGLGGTGSTSPGSTFNLPLSATGSFPAYSVSCTLCLTTAGGQLIASADTFGSAATVAPLHTSVLIANGYLSLPATAATSGASQPIDFDWTNSGGTQGDWLVQATSTGQLCLALNQTCTAFLDQSNVFHATGIVTSTTPSQILGSLGSCTNAPSIVYGICFGSGNGTTNLAAFVVGKQSGGFGGTSASNSAQACWYANNGTTDVGTTIYLDSTKVLQIGNTGQLCGAGTAISSIRLGANTAISGWATAQANGGTSTYLPPVYNDVGGATGSTMHSVFKEVSVTLNSCATGTACTFSAGQSQTFSGASAFASAATYSCTATNTGGTGNIFVTMEPVSGTSATFYVLNFSGTSVSGTLPLSYHCLGS